jgi:hypothetical protein
MSSAFGDGLTDMTDRNPLLKPFDALTGTWITAATHPLVDAVVPGAVTFEWQDDLKVIYRRRN